MHIRHFSFLQVFWVRPLCVVAKALCLVRDLESARNRATSLTRKGELENHDKTKALGDIPIRAFRDLGGEFQRVASHDIWDQAAIPLLLPADRRKPWRARRGIVCNIEQSTGSDSAIIWAMLAPAVLKTREPCKLRIRDLIFRFREIFMD